MSELPLTTARQAHHGSYPRPGQAIERALAEMERVTEALGER